MIKNLTPHPIDIQHIDEYGDDTVVSYRTIPPEPISARLSERIVSAGYHDDIPLVRVEFGDLQGLPDMEPGTLLIVSMLIKNVVNRPDLVSPADMVRDSQGRIVGCRSLSF